MPCLRFAPARWTYRFALAVCPERETMNLRARNVNLSFVDWRLLFHRRQQLVQTVLGVAEKHHALLVVIQFIVHAGETGTHAALENNDGFGSVHFKDWHAVERTAAVV